MIASGLRKVLCAAGATLAFALFSGCSDTDPENTPSGARTKIASSEALPQPRRPSAEAVSTLGINQEDRLIARIQDRTAEELGGLLIRAEEAVAAWEFYPDFDPIEFILDGPEARLFMRASYQDYRELVDRAARLDAFGVIDVKICERWMEANEVMQSDFPAFVDTVNYGPAAKRDLLREGYIYF